MSASSRGTEAPLEGLPVAHEGLILRIGLIAAGGLLLQTSQSLLVSAPTIHIPADLIGIMGSSAIGLLALLAAGLRRPPSVLRWLILLAFLAEILFNAQVWLQTYGFSLSGKRYPALVGIDSALDTELAAALLIHGHNPYTWDYGGTMALYRADNSAATATLQGALASHFPYPALSFLLAVPFQLLRLPALFCLTVLAQIVLLIALFVAAPEHLQPLILLPLGVGISFTWLTLTGVMDIIWAAFLVAMVLAWRRPMLRALLFGLAIAIKQDPWLAAPFVLIRLWYADDEDDPPSHRVMYFTLVVAATFLLVNLPFIAADPAAWLHGVFAPFVEAYVYLSVGGLAALTQSGLVYLPKTYYTLAALCILAVLLACYWRFHVTLRDTLWILPGIFIWFAYRTLPSYWLYWTFPLLATVGMHTGSLPALLPVSPVSLAWRRPLAVVSAVILMLVAIGRLVASPATLDIAVHPPVMIDGQGHVTSLSLEITNKSNTMVAPRIAVQHGASSVVAWQIDEGAPTLQPGQTAAYRASSANSSETFFVWETAQIVVTDAGGSYELRGVATLAADSTYLWPDAVENPAYAVWYPGANSPVAWALRVSPVGSGAVALAKKDGRDALAITLSPSTSISSSGFSHDLTYAAVESSLTFPRKPLGIWLYVDPPQQNGESNAYGIETDDGDHRLWMVFGPQSYNGPSPAQAILNRIVPQRQWVYQQIDLAQTYADLHWPIPGLQPILFRGLASDFRPVRLRLFVAASGQKGPVVAYFGPIVQDYRIPPETLMAEVLADPAAYYVRLGDAYLKQSNYRRAIDAYQQALDFSPGNESTTIKLENAQSIFYQEYGR